MDRTMKAYLELFGGKFVEYDVEDKYVPPPNLNIKVTLMLTDTYNIKRLGVERLIKINT
jgi:hypothetical protein